MQGKKFVFGALVAFALAAVAPAQGTTVPGPVISAGSNVQVSYSDPGQAGQTVTVDIVNGSGGTSSVEITLDPQGHGTASWPVPEDWFVAFFTGPDGFSVMRPIDV